MVSKFRTQAISTWTILLVAGVSAAIAGEGAGSTGGGDNKSAATGAMWFLGVNKKISTCYEISKTFGVPPSKVESDLNDAVQTWKSYFIKKRDASVLEGPAGDEAVQPSFNLEIHSKCAGNEDLKLYLGVTNSEVQQAAREYENPTAFAHRKSYDIDAGWGKGFIWVSQPYVMKTRVNDADLLWPDWSKPYVLRGILLHELGHVLGCEHVAGTLMTEGVATNILLGSYGSPNAEKSLTQIDQARELVMSRKSTAIEAEGRISWPLDPSLPKTFKLFTGRDPVGNAELGEIKAKIIRAAGETGKLILSDRLGTAAEVPFTISWGRNKSFWGGGMVFKRFRKHKISETSPDYFLAGLFGGNGAFQTGHVKAADGTQRILLITRNEANAGDEGYIHLRYFDQDEPVELFENR